jgi:probable phosphoglycerate mutase
MGLILYLVRHGHAENNRDGVFPDDDANKYRLTERGVEEAKGAAELLKTSGAEVIFSSPVYRAYETATIIGESLGLGVKVDERLREVGLGRLKNVSVKTVFESNPDWFLEYFDERTVYGIEKYDSIRKRMLEFVKDILVAEYTKVIAVSHLEPIRALITIPLKLSGKDVRKIEIHNASITVVKFESQENLENFKVVTINCVPFSRL